MQIIEVVCGVPGGRQGGNGGSVQEDRAGIIGAPERRDQGRRVRYCKCRSECNRLVTWGAVQTIRNPLRRGAVERVGRVKVRNCRVGRN